MERSVHVGKRCQQGVRACGILSHAGNGKKVPSGTMDS